MYKIDLPKDNRDSGGKLSRLALPYKVLEVRRSEFVLLNRKYKPLGLNTSEWVDYESPSIIYKMRLTDDDLEKLSFEGIIERTEGGMRSVYLYNDSCPPHENLDAYFEKYKVLLARKVS